MTSKQKICSEMKAKPTQTAFAVALLAFTVSWFPPAALWAEVKQGWQICSSTEWRCWQCHPKAKCQIYLLSTPSLCLFPIPSISQGFLNHLKMQSTNSFKILTGCCGFEFNVFFLVLFINT